MTDTTKINRDYVGLDLTVAEPIVVTINCDTITLTREEVESISAAMKEAAKHIAIGSPTQYSLDVRQDTHYDIDAALTILNSKLKE